MRIYYLKIVVLMMLPFGGFSQDTIALKKYVGNLKKVELTINNKPFSFLFDTGGGETLLSPEVASLLGKPVYGKVTGFRMTGEVINYQKCDSVSLKINSASLFHASVGVWDIMKVLPKELPKIDGVLSLKSFNDKLVTLDFISNRIILETRVSFQKKVKNMTLLKSRFANGQDGNDLTILLGVLKSDHPYWFLFDSGNLDDLLLSHATASAWGLESDTITQRNNIGKVTIQFGQKDFVSQASSKSLIYDGSLNYSIISQAIFLINFAERKIWIN